MGNRARSGSKQKYPQRATLTRFEVMRGTSPDTTDTEAAFFDAATMRSVRPAGGTWTGKVALVQFGTGQEVAIPGTVDAVHEMIQKAAR